jgi:hypothetical protein
MSPKLPGRTATFRSSSVPDQSQSCGVDTVNGVSAKTSVQAGWPAASP